MTEWFAQYGVVNPYMLLVASLQVGAGVHGFLHSAPKAAAIMMLVGLANCIMATIRA